MENVVSAFYYYHYFFFCYHCWYSIILKHTNTCTSTTNIRSEKLMFIWFSSIFSSGYIIVHFCIYSVMHTFTVFSLAHSLLLSMWKRWFVYCIQLLSIYMSNYCTDFHRSFSFLQLQNMFATTTTLTTKIKEKIEKK